jgi:hypothetical protein
MVLRKQKARENKWAIKCTKSISLVRLPQTREHVPDVRRVLSWQNISTVSLVADAVTLSSSAKTQRNRPNPLKFLLVLSVQDYSPTIAMTHLTKMSTPTIAVRTTSIMNNPGKKASAEAETSSAIGNVTMNGRVATVRDTSSLETIELTSVRIQIA